MAEDNSNDPNRRELSYSKDYRKRYEEKYRKKNGSSNSHGDEKVSSLNTRGDDKGNKILSEKESKLLQNKEPKLPLDKDNNITSSKNEAQKDNKQSILKKGPRWEKLVIILAYFIVFDIAVYFILAGFAPDKLPLNSKEYVISASDSGILDSLSSFYIDKQVLGGKEQIGNKTMRLITSAGGFNLVFSPKVTVPANSTGKISISVYGNGSDVYMNDKLIIPDLSNYVLARDYPNESVWVRNGLNSQNLIASDNAGDFIYKNYPGYKVYSFKSLDYAPTLADYNQSWTKLGTTFRDNLKLAVYADGSLDVKFTKQDMNALVGKDEYTVEIKDSANNKVFNKTYADDGDRTNSRKLGPEQDFEINVNDLARGIYYISFVKDSYNAYSDMYLENLRVNSNKVLILGTFIPTASFNFYTESNSDKTIGFNYWDQSGNQTIKIDNQKKEFGDICLNKRCDFNISSGEHEIQMPKGNAWTFVDTISPSQKSWFYLPVTPDSNMKNPDVILIDKTKLKLDGQESVYTGGMAVSSGSKIKLQALEENKIYLERVDLELD